MAKPTIVTRASKGSALTWTEGDTNLTNLQNATISVTDGTNTAVLDLNDTLTLTAGTNISLSVNATTDTVTINSTASGGIDLTDLSGSDGINYNNTTGAIKLTNSGLPSIVTGSVSSIDGTTDYIYATTTTGLMTSYQISFTGAGLTGTNIYTASYYWITNIDSGNNRFQISDTMGGPAKDLNTASNLTDVTYTVTSGGSGTYKLQYNSSSQTFSWASETTGSASLSSLSDVSITPPITNGHVLTYNSGMWQAAAPSGGGGDVVSDTTPQLGGNLDVNGNAIVSVSNGNIRLEPNGTGNIMLTPSTGQIILGSTNYPTAMPTSGDVLTAGAGGQLSWAAPSGGYPQITDDTSTNASRYILFDDSTSGNASSVGVSSTKLTYNPSTGTLVSTIFTGTFKGYNEGAIYDLGTTGGTIAPNVTNGNVQKITLNSALTINAFTSPVAGQSLTLIIYGGTAYTSITSTMKFAGGVKTLTATAGCIDILSIYYDGTNYFASLGKGYA